MAKIEMKRLMMAVLLLFGLTVFEACAEEPVRLGILAVRTQSQELQRWQPLALYLQNNLNRPVELSVYTLDDLDQAIAHNKLDILLTNPGQYILLRHRSGLSAPLVTLVNKSGDVEVKGMGGVIFVRADAVNIQTLGDIVGKKIAVPNIYAFGTYQLQVFEMLEAGLQEPHQAKLSITGFPQDSVVDAVMAGRADVGFVRTSLLESLANEGKLDLSKIRIINRQNLPSYPYLSSTRLYPEWPLAVMPHVDDHLAARLTSLLLVMPESVFPTAAGIHGFSVPADYSSTEEVLRRLRMPPYENPPEIRLHDLWVKHSLEIVILGLFILLLAGMGIMLWLKSRIILHSQKIYRTLFETVHHGVVYQNAKGEITSANPAAERILGLTLAQMQGRTSIDQHWQSVHPNGDAFPSDIHPAMVAIKTGKSVFDVTMGIKNPKLENTTWINVCAIPTFISGTDKIDYVYNTLEDITERRQAEEQIWSQANFDALTKLPNRHMFHDRLEQSAKKSLRAGLSMALMLIDLDRFKEVNDALGHDQGDLLLIDVSKRIQACVRDSDTVARLGGDEFTVILSELEEVASIERIAQEINSKLALPFQLGSEEAYISASIGISIYPNDGVELEVLFKNADQAMYVAKSMGRNRFSFFTTALQEAAQKRLRLTKDLRGALADQQFRVYYQPIVELSTGHIRKAEALIRWQHPERGLVSPLEFIPLAEETGMIVDIGYWVFQEAARQVKQWQASFNPAFQISVNRSPVQFQNHAAGSNLPSINYLNELNVPGHSIVFEITEGLLLDAHAGVKDTLLQFSEAGIQVALDDFGTGYSSLSYLKKFDIDYLKIDKSFVDHLITDKNDVALCEAIIVMAHKLGLKVIAEGIETEAQCKILVEAGCDYGQGYLFSRPVPPQEFEKLLWN